MISPALTVWPPKRFTPRRCALESRPLRVELAPFLCAMVSSPRELRLLDAGDLDARELLAVALALLVAGLVLELLDVDLRAAEILQDLGGHGDLGQGVGVGGDLVTVDQQHRRELDLAVLAGLDTVHRHDGADLDLLLSATGAHNCVNHLSVPFRRGTAPGAAVDLVLLFNFSGNNWRVLPEAVAPGRSQKTMMAAQASPDTHQRSTLPDTLHTVNSASPPTGDSQGRSGPRGSDCGTGS